jgi:hypothetical protein
MFSSAQTYIQKNTYNSGMSEDMFEREADFNNGILSIITSPDQNNEMAIVYGFVDNEMVKFATLINTDEISDRKFISVDKQAIYISDPDYNSDGRVFVYYKPDNGWSGNIGESFTINCPDTNLKDFGGSISALNNKLLIKASSEDDNYNYVYVYSVVKETNTARLENVFTIPVSGTDFSYKRIRFIDDNNFVVAGALTNIKFGVRVYSKSTENSNWSADATHKDLTINDTKASGGIQDIEVSGNAIFIGDYEYNDDGGVIVIEKSGEDWNTIEKVNEFYEEGDEMSYGTCIYVKDSVLMVGADADYYDEAYGSVFVYHKNGDSWRNTEFVSKIERQADIRVMDDYFGGYICSNDDAFYIGAIGEYSDEGEDYYGSFSSFKYAYRQKADFSNGGIVFPDIKNVFYEESHTFMVFPDLGYDVETANYNDQQITLTKENNYYKYSVNNVKEVGLLNVSFKKKLYELTVSSESGVLVTPESAELAYDESQEFIITMSDNYTIESVLFGNKNVTSWLVEDDNSYKLKIQNLTKDSIIKINTMPINYFVKESFGPNGNVVKSGSKNYNIESTITYTITPDNGYNINRAEYNGADISNDLVNSNGEYSYTLKNVTADGELIITFAAESYTISVINGDGGTVDKTGTKNITILDNTIFKIKPDVGFAISKITLDGVNILNDLVKSGDTYIYVLCCVDSDKELIVEYVPVRYNVSITTGSGGTVSPGQSTTVGYNESIDISIIPDEHYVLKSVKLGGIDIISQLEKFDNEYKYTISEIEEDISIEVDFQKTTSVSVNISNNMKLFPNPFVDKIHINIPELSENGYLYVSDINGNVLLRKNIDTNRFVLDMSEFNGVLYILTIRYRDQLITRKVIRAGTN